MLFTSVDATTHYEKAIHIGRKENGTPLVLDDILKEKHIYTPAEVPLGIVQIPVEQIVGTKSAGRSNCFSRGFYPLLNVNTEFASKWISLCTAHLNEGIHDAVKAYEFMNQFYILEGNKRVSVLKYFGAVTIPADVTRIIPPQIDDRETRIYYEFMDFYSLSKVNYIYFSRPGSFSKLQRQIGKQPNEVWSEDDQINFSSVYTRFKTEFLKLVSPKLNIRAGDAFLYFITLYDYPSLIEESPAEFHKKMLKTRDEFKLLGSSQNVKLQMSPSDTKKNPLLSLVPIGTPKLKAAFIHNKNPEVSGWTNSHDGGRRHLEKTFANEISTEVYNDIDLSTISSALDEAIGKGCQLIFTTSPIFLKDSLKAAIDHPKIKILNCSLFTSHKHIRTYYARMYEVKYLLGAIAGAMSESGRLGYIADYPIYGSISCINAFALGAKMVNPRAKIYLQWSKALETDLDDFFEEHQAEIICGNDSITAGHYNRQFGLYSTRYSQIWNMAMPVWNWSIFYERIVQNIMNGNWKNDDSKDKTKGLNYWWGMSSGIVDVIFSHRLPIGTLRLIELLKNTISKGDFNPFSGILYSQEGIIQNEADKTLSPEQVITMDWLAENVVGNIPEIHNLVEGARILANYQGLKEEENLL